MISNDDTIANAVSGKTARPCDCCIRKRARWYCPADDAFLCQGCDASVHCANPLARRHDRVRLKTASLKPVYLPTWHRGLTRKPRTPRHAKHSSALTLRVPELDTTSSVSTDSEDIILYQVPILDPETESYQPSDFDDFSADVETLLGKGLDDGSCGIDDLGFLECSIHNDEDTMVNADVAITEPFDLSFVYDEKKISLRLDYEAISEAWASQQGSSSPWMDGQRPQINLDDCWPQFFLQLGSIGAEIRHGEKQEDGEREARVSRYREKRRRRLFSKKIRYEVRKLNAEKRPRMKGRFVKRSSLLS